jgi:glycosyltransferase involved in cell wall biosynthesis
MIVVFCIPQFKPENFLLQPWLTVHKVAKGLNDRGFEVHVISDKEGPKFIDGIRMHSVRSLRGTHSKLLSALLQAIKPDSVIVTVTPLSLATAGWYQVLGKYSAYGYVSYPFYTKKQIIKALRYIDWRERWEYGRHIFVPRSIWAGKLVNLFDGIICQSAHTAQKIAGLTNFKIHPYAISPGIDTEWLASETGPKAAHSNDYFLYVGTASKIRGFLLLLDAFSWLSDSNIRLKVFARGADETEIKEIKKEIEIRKLEARVTIRGGWIGTDELKKQIQSATAVLFPFILVPSEMPVSVLEAIYCGTPVIVSDLVGLPEVVGNAGIVVPHADVQKMASAIQTLHRNKVYQTELNALCCERRNTIMSWNSVCKLWADLITR